MLNKRPLSLCAIFLLTALYGCRAGYKIPAATDTVEKVKTEQIQQTEQVMIRVLNKSAHQIDDIVIHFAASDNGVDFVYQSEEYGSLAPAETSTYRPIGASFRYAPIEASVDSKQVQQGVTDYLGEVPIPNGNYTYEITYGPSEQIQQAATLDGALVYDSSDLDRKIDSALDAEITKAIAMEYYKNETQTYWFDCVHQQTHRGSNRRNSHIVVYAKIVCTEPSSEPHPNKQIEGISPLPIRIELAETEGSLSVVEYQFLEETSQTEDDSREIFLPQTLTAIRKIEIEEETYNRLRFEAGISGSITEYRR